MRSTVRVVMAVLMAIVLSLSCNLVMPERIEISGSPTVDVSAGSLAVDITEYVDLEAMLTDSLSGAFSDPPGDRFYTLAPGETDEYTLTKAEIYTVKARKQLFTQPLADIFDMDTALGGLTQTIEPMAFPVPEFTVSGNYSKTLSGDSLGTLSIPALDPIALVEVDVPSQIVMVPGAGGLNITDFYTLTLASTPASGSLVVYLSTTNASPELDLEVSGARLLDGDNNLLVSATIVSPVNVNPSGSITFDLTGLTLPNQLNFELTLSMANAQVPDPNFELHLVASLESLNIQSATGVTFSDTVTGSESVTLDKPADLVSATIGAGELLITLAPPAGYSNVSTAFTGSLTFESSQARTAALVSGSTYKIDLAGISLSTFDPASLDYVLEVTGADATVAFPEDFGITTSMNITNFTEVVLSAADLDFSYTDLFIIDQAILDAVQSATFSDARLVFNLTNGLPSVLNIDFLSQVLTGGVTESLSFAGNSSSLDSQSITLANSIDFIADLVAVGMDKAIDISLGINLAVYSGGQLTLTNVVPGQNYLFSGDFELVLDLATVTLADVNQTGTFPEGGGDKLDFSILDDFLPAGVMIEGVTTMLELQNTLGLGLDLVLLGRHSATGSEPYTYVDLLDDPQDGAVTVTAANFASPQSYSNSVNLAAGSSVPMYLADLVNARAANLELAYSVTFIDPVIDLSATEAGSIDVFLDLEIPLQLKVTPAGGVYWMPLDDLGDPMLNITEDLLGRDPLVVDGDLPDNEDLEEVFDFLRSASIRYTLNNSVISGLNGDGDPVYPAIAIYQGGIDFESSPFQKIIHLGGADILELDWQDIDFIRNNLFMPTVELYLPQGLISLDPAGELSIDLGLRLETDVVYEFSFGKDDSYVQ